MESDSVTRICLVGATGLIGKSVIREAVGRDNYRIIGVARREVPLPRGARMEMLLCEPAGWSDAIAAANAKVLVCALGTTMRKAGSREEFRAVDHDLAIASARAARDAGIRHAVFVSSVGADPGQRNFYLRTKGETEAALAKLGFRRLDIIRPGLLVGSRDEARPLERLGMLVSPFMNLFLHGGMRRFRAIEGGTVARAILALTREKAGGRFVHDYDAMHRAIRRAGD